MTGDRSHSPNDVQTGWLGGEVARWRADGVISSDQADQILARYALADGPVEDHTGPGRLITAISTIGAILLGVGVILFFAANWTGMGSWTKVAVIFTAIGLAYALGYLLRYRPGNYPKVGDSLILLGALLFGSGVFLIEQAFHMRADDPIGVLLWTIGVLPLAYVLAHRGLLGLGLLTFLLWFGWEMVDSQADGKLIHFVLTFLTIGIIYAAFGYHHERLASLKRFEGLYRGLGMFVAFVALHVLTYQFFWEWGDHWSGSRASEVGAPALLVAMLVIALIAAATVPLRQSGRRATLLLEAAGMATVIVVAIFAAVSSGAGDGYAVLFNLVYFGAVLGVVAIGYLNAEPYAVNIGLLFFAIGVVARYFDFFWDLMPRSMFFIAGGLVLLAGSLALERFRRQLMTNMVPSEGV